MFDSAQYRRVRRRCSSLHLHAPAHAQNPCRALQRVCREGVQEQTGEPDQPQVRACLHASLPACTRAPATLRGPLPYAPVPQLALLPLSWSTAPHRPAAVRAAVPHVPEGV